MAFKKIFCTFNLPYPPTFIAMQRLQYILLSYDSYLRTSLNATAYDGICKRYCHRRRHLRRRHLRRRRRNGKCNFAAVTKLS